MLELSLDNHKAAVGKCGHLVGERVLFAGAWVGNLNAAGLITNDDELDPLLVPEGLYPATDCYWTILLAFQFADF